MGQSIRLCCFYGVEAVFIPIRDPWRNGAVEKFYDHWNHKFYRRIHMNGVEDLWIESQDFEVRHNIWYHYSSLGGRPPVQAMETSGINSVFPAKLAERKFPTPVQGAYCVVRYILRDGILDVFGEHFQLPGEAVYEYVTATIDVTQERMVVDMGGAKVG